MTTAQSLKSKFYSVMPVFSRSHQPNHPTPSAALFVFSLIWVLADLSPAVARSLMPPLPTAIPLTSRVAQLESPEAESTDPESTDTESTDTESTESSEIDATETLATLDSLGIDLEQASAVELQTAGIEQYRARNYALAIDLLSKVIELEPSVEAHRYRALAHHQQGDRAVAISDYSAALSLQPEAGLQAIILSDRGLAHYENGDNAAAVADYTAAIALQPDYAPPYNHRGVVSYVAGNYQEAIGDYDVAIAKKTDYAAAYNNRGLAYFALRNFDQAIANYAQAISHDPNYRDAYYNRGNAYFYRADYRNALNDLNQTIALDANYANAYFVRGAIAEQMGDRPAAIADYQTAATLYQEQGNPAWQQNALDRLNLLQSATPANNS